MNITLIGYGKMGKEIARHAKDRNHQIPLVIDLENRDKLTPENLLKTDVAIEFTTPETAFENISACLRAGIPVVSGTTGWLDRWNEAEKLCQQYEGGLFYASNFSIGVNILFALNKYLAQKMEQFPQYTPSMREVHHIHKVDAPSGTAISLAQQLIEELPDIQNWKLKDENPVNDEKILSITAEREGEVNGFHSISYDSEVDTITIQHNAKSRAGFATGAILAAEYMAGKTGIHSMKEMLNL